MLTDAELQTLYMNNWRTEDAAHERVERYGKAVIDAVLQRLGGPIGVTSTNLYGTASVKLTKKDIPDGIPVYAIPEV